MHTRSRTLEGAWTRLRRCERPIAAACSDDSWRGSYDHSRMRSLEELLSYHPLEVHRILCTNDRPDFPTKGMSAHRALPEPRPRVPRSRSLLCASHTITRVQNTLDTHAARVCGSPPPHMLTHGNTRLHVKMLLRCSCHWPLASCRPSTRWHRQHAHKHCDCSASCTARESRSSCANAVHTSNTNIATVPAVHRHDDDERDDLERDEAEE